MRGELTQIYSQLGLDSIPQAEAHLTTGIPHRIHIAVSSAAKPVFPLEPYVQAGWGDAHVPMGTVVVPVHPSLIGDLNLKRELRIVWRADIRTL